MSAFLVRLSMLFVIVTLGLLQNSVEGRRRDHPLR
jgi:hypothetical protein